jgi:hypothetical protein
MPVYLAYQEHTSMYNAKAYSAASEISPLAFTTSPGKKEDALLVDGGFTAR